MKIHVYHNIDTPVVYEDNLIESNKDVYLQCISMIHYNPLICLKPDQIKNNDSRFVNCCTSLTGDYNNNQVYDEYDEYNPSTLMDNHECKPLTSLCNHVTPICGITVEIGNFCACALILSLIHI